MFQLFQLSHFTSPDQCSVTRIQIVKESANDFKTSLVRTPVGEMSKSSGVVSDLFLYFKVVIVLLDHTVDQL